MKKILYITRNERLGLIMQSKNLLILFFVVVVYEECLSVLMELSTSTNLGIGFMESFLLLTNNKLNIIAIPLLFIIVMSAFPRCRMDYFGMIRMDKKTWLIGEILFVIEASFVVLFVIFLGTVLFSVTRSQFTFNWSSFMRKFAIQFPELYQKNTSMILGGDFLTHGKPLVVVFYTFAVMWLYLIIMGIIMLAGIIGRHKLIAIGGNVALTIISGGAFFLKSSFSWLFPMFHVVFGNHFYSVYSGYKFPVWGTFAYLIVIIGLLIGFCTLKLKKLSIGE